MSNSEGAIPLTENRVSELEESETIKNGDDNGNEELAIEIGGVPPILYKHPLRQRNRLEPDGRCELPRDLRSVMLDIASLGLNSVNFFQQ